MNILLTLITILSIHAAQDRLEPFTTVLETSHTQERFHGAVLVATHGEVEYSGAIGLGDREKGSPITTKSQFRIASMTKVFTAVLTMKLVEEEKIDLEGTIGDYLPDYKGNGKSKVTIHHLLAYSSGIENELEQLGMEPYQDIESLDEFIDDYCSGDLVSVPGETSEYGNTEYILLHAIIERVSGRRYADYLKDVVLVPLALQNTHMAQSKPTPDGFLPSYSLNDSLNVFEKDVAYYPELYFGAGAVYSTVEDLLVFDQALFNHDLLSRESTERLLTTYPKYGNTAYGLWGSSGWGTFSEPFYYRTGGILGSNANWIHTMDTGKTIIVLSNTNATNLYALSEELYRISVGKPAGPR